MHPEICRFPSLHFYDRKLVNGDQMSDKSASFHATEGLGPYLFFDVVDGHELHGKNSGGLSLYNESEADAAVEILSFFKKRYIFHFPLVCCFCGKKVASNFAFGLPCSGTHQNFAEEELVS